MQIELRCSPIQLRCFIRSIKGKSKKGALLAIDPNYSEKQRGERGWATVVRRGMVRPSLPRARDSQVEAWVTEAANDVM